MCLAFILAAALVALNPQAAATEENPPKPAAGQAEEKGSGVPLSENKADETHSATKGAEPNAQKPPSTPVPAGSRKRRTRTKKPATPDGEPRKIVIHQGGTSEPVAQILPGISLEEANRQRESAEQLLEATDASVKQLATRSLRPNQQGMLVQIRQYIDGARSALKESDPQRAHTLALKAYLLSDDLVKHP